MAHRPALAVTVLALIAGCKVGPDYHGPPVSAAGRPGASWSGLAEATPASTALGVSPTAGLATSRPSTVAAGGVVVDRWWATLGDATLDTLVDQAARSNLTVAAAAARVRAARARTSGAVAGLFPTARGDGQYSFDHASGPLFPVDTGDYQFGAIGFDASWELDLFGGTRRAIEEAGDDQQAAVEARRDALVSVLAEVCRSYVALRTAQRRAAIATNNLGTANRLLDLTRRERAAGLAGDLDVARARAEVTVTAAALPPLDAEARRQIHNLGVLLGGPPDALLGRLAVPAAIPMGPPRVPVGLPSALLRRRPDVRGAERRLAGATASIGVAVANLYPDVSLNGDGGLGAVAVSDLFNWSSRFYSVGPQARWLLFDAGRVLADVDSRRAIRDEQLADYKLTVLSAVRDVEDAIVVYGREQDRRDLYRQTVEADAEALRIARDQYANGVTGFLTVLDAERSLFAAQDQLAVSDGAIAVDLVSLYKALGGGWQSAEGLRPAARPYPKGPMPAAQLVVRQ